MRNKTLLLMHRNETMQKARKKRQLDQLKKKHPWLFTRLSLEIHESFHVGKDDIITRVTTPIIKEVPI